MFNAYNRYNSLDIDITYADPPELLGIAAGKGVVLTGIRNIDSLTIRVTCLYKDLKMLERICTKCGANCRIYRKRKRIWNVLTSRTTLLLGCALLLMLVLVLPSRIFFVRIVGNTYVPTKLILEEAENSGIRFGVSRRTVRSEKIKNALLSAVPQLQWLGINTKGCVATISVREKTVEEPESDDVGIGSIVASTDGIIQSCTVLNGTAMCGVGDAVLAGETLVSGYTDCGITLKEVKADAEITALTIRSITAISPCPDKIRSYDVNEERKYSIRIGKKLINFFKDSGISDTSCVKIYSEEYLNLPGGFSLPVSLITQRYIYSSCTDEWENDCDTWLADIARKYMILTRKACRVISENTQLEFDGDLCVFNGKYICLEDIGQFVNEEIVSNDRQTN